MKALTLGLVIGTSFFVGSHLATRALMDCHKSRVLTLIERPYYGGIIRKLRFSTDTQGNSFFRGTEGESLVKKEAALRASMSD